MPGPPDPLRDREATAARRADDEFVADIALYHESRDPEVRQRIITGLTPLVSNIARRYTFAEPLDDLMQEGFIGLLSALDLFDSAKHVKFTTYATHFITGQIRHHLRDRGKLIREPAWMQELSQRIARASEALAQRLSRDPSPHEIASEIDVTEETVVEVLASRDVFRVRSTTAVEGPAGGDASGDEMHWAVDRNSFETPLEDRVTLENATRKLKAIEQTVLDGYYFKGLSQNELSEKLDISVNYVSHILRAAKKKLGAILRDQEVESLQREMAAMRSQLNSQRSIIERDVLVDPVTRLFNKSYFHSRIDEEISRASRIEGEVSIVFICIRGLKAASLHLGTLFSDRIVGAMATALKDTVRRVDISIRYGDDMFALILPHTGKNVHIVVGRVSAAFREALTEQDPDNRALLSIATGSAVYPADGRSAQDLIGAASVRLDGAAPDEHEQRGRDI